MKESIGYTVSLNLMIVFITIILAFLCAALIYFKSNKVSNVITTAIEKYEGYNEYAIGEINRNLNSIGYGSHSIASKCTSPVKDETDSDGYCYLVSDESGDGRNGYCVFECYESTGEYYFYKIRTNMMINIPIINDILDVPIYSNTNRLYNFN